MGLSTTATDSGIFIEFMLEEILTTLKKRQCLALKTKTSGTVNCIVNDTVNLIKANPKITMDELAMNLNKSRRTVTRIIKKLQDEGIISRVG